MFIHWFVTPVTESLLSSPGPRTKDTEENATNGSHPQGADCHVGDSKMGTCRESARGTTAPGSRGRQDHWMVLHTVLHAAPMPVGQA